VIIKGIALFDYCINLVPKPTNHEKIILASARFSRHYPGLSEVREEKGI
jgi:hypothetical protein